MFGSSNQKIANLKCRDKKWGGGIKKDLVEWGGGCILCKNMLETLLGVILAIIIICNYESKRSN